MVTYKIGHTNYEVLLAYDGDIWLQNPVDSLDIVEIEDLNVDQILDIKELIQVQENNS